MVDPLRKPTSCGRTACVCVAYVNRNHATHNHGVKSCSPRRSVSLSWLLLLLLLLARARAGFFSDVGDVVAGAFREFSYNVLDDIFTRDWSDRAFVLQRVKFRCRYLKQASKELRNDRHIVLAALKDKLFSIDTGSEIRFFCGLEHASERLRGDRALLLAAIKEDIEASICTLKYASKKGKRDRIVVLAAIKKNAESFQYASEELKRDRAIVLEAVKRRGFSLEYASRELRGDRTIVLAAVKTNGAALQFASKELRGDRAIVLAAVKRDVHAYRGRSHGHGAEYKTRKHPPYTALQYASPELRGDRTFVLAAIEEDSRAIRHASEELRKEGEVGMLKHQLKEAKTSTHGEL